MCKKISPLFCWWSSCLQCKRIQLWGYITSFGRSNHYRLAWNSSLILRVCVFIISFAFFFIRLRVLSVFFCLVESCGEHIPLVASHSLEKEFVSSLKKWCRWKIVRYCTLFYILNAICNIWTSRKFPYSSIKCQFFKAGERMWKKISPWITNGAFQIPHFGRSSRLLRLFSVIVK